MTGRLETRIGRLEAAMPISGGVPSAVVRFNPGPGAAGWLPGMFAKIGWPAAKVALVTIDGSGAVGEEPKVVVPPIGDENLDEEQHAALAQAGRHSGPWSIAIAGRNWTDPVPMPDGQGALLAELKRQDQRNQWGHHDGL